MKKEDLKQEILEAVKERFDVFDGRFLEDEDITLIIPIKVNERFEVVEDPTCGLYDFYIQNGYDEIICFSSRHDFDEEFKIVFEKYDEELNFVGE